MIASKREQMRLLNKQLRQLEEMKKAITDEAARLEVEASAARRDGTRAAAIDESLLEVLTFCKEAVMEPQADLMREAARICDRHGSSPAAMGLLYGCLVELIRNKYSAGSLDMVEQRQYAELKERIKSLIEI